LNEIEKPDEGTERSGIEAAIREWQTAERTKATLSRLAAEINEEHRLCDAAMKSGLEHAIRAGELLIEAKEVRSWGNWLEWLKENFEGSVRTAQAYMQVARNRHKFMELEVDEQGNTQHVAHLSLRDTWKAIAAPTTLKHPDLTRDPPPGEPTSREEVNPRQLEKKLRNVGFSPKFARWMTQEMASRSERSRSEGSPRPETSEPTVREVLKPEDFADLPSGEFDRAEEKASLTSKIVPRRTDDPAEVAEACYRLYGDGIASHIRWADEIANWYAMYRDELVAQQERGLRPVK
jgi:hypothetical protein